MLVLHRRIGQSFYIGEQIKITVAGTDTQSVKIGIRAPSDLSIDREENMGKTLPQCAAKAIHIRWDTDDVHAAIDELSLPKIDNDQAFGILKTVLKEYDVNQGVNWDVIKHYVLEYHKEKEDERGREASV